MVFSSQVFVFIFLPVAFIINTVIMLAGKKHKVAVSNVWLLVTSLFFYAWGEPLAVLLLVAETLLCWLFALFIGKFPDKRKLFLVASLVVSLGLLCVFKYTGFIMDTLSEVTGVAKIGELLPEIALPLGISFFTFQLLSYVIDVYNEKAEPQKNPARLLLYVAFFPQLVAGPIVKYKEVEARLTDRSFEPVSAAEGLRRFMTGMAKKIIIANNVALIADSVFALETEKISSVAAILGGVAYTLQIYFDFSGYSDMAIGIGKMFGFTFSENFNYPFVSFSVKDFWRRWHISVSSWFKEYLYFPLGGNRKGKLRACVNRIIVFFFTGLWHGANFTFVLWGLWHGFFLLLEEYTKPLTERLKVPVLKKILGYVYTAAVVVPGFIMFRSDTVAYGFSYIGRIFSGTGGLPSGVLAVVTPFTCVIFALALVAMLPWKVWLGRLFAGKAMEKPYEIILYLGTILLFVLSVLQLAGSSYNPFIYFRF